jgi:predicted HTH domain antitoxin
MPTRSIRLSEAEANEIRQLRAETGEAEESLLRRAALRGIRDLRLELSIQAFSNGRGSAEAAAIAGLPRAIFLDLLADRGVTLLEGPSTLGAEAEALARRLGDQRLADVARTLPSRPA